MDESLDKKKERYDTSDWNLANMQVTSVSRYTSDITLSWWADNRNGFQMVFKFILWENYRKKRKQKICEIL